MTRVGEAPSRAAAPARARDQALLENAKIDVQRYRVLYKQDSIPQQQLSTQESLVRQFEGTVKNDRGLIESVTWLVLTMTRV